MTRGVDERVASVRGLLAAAERVHAAREHWVPALVRSTGLSPEGVALGFASLEREASDDELRALVAAAGDAAHVHVVLSGNVFVAPLRALALARAASAKVTVQPSSRDPVLAEALVAAANDRAIALVPRGAVPDGADRVDVYGRDETIAEVRARVRAGVEVRGHGAGLGVAVVRTGDAIADAATALAEDVVPFDQRGCLSPRVVLVAGARARGEALGERLHGALADWASRVPRGTLTATENAESRRWRDTLVFTGRVWEGAQHAVAHAAFDARGFTALVPPSGRHVLVLSVTGDAAGEGRESARALASIARFVVTAGALDPAWLAASAIAPPHARLARLGAMQRPPLDGPVDRRGLLGVDAGAGV
jgi:hypothetical protein